MQETPPNILCMPRAYRPSGNWQPQEYTRIIYCTQVATLKDFVRNLWHPGNPKPWSGHLELLWPQLSVWPKIAVALAGLSWQSLSLLGRGGGCSECLAIIQKCCWRLAITQLMLHRLSIRTPHVDPSPCFVSEVLHPEYKRYYQDLQTASELLPRFFFWSNVSGCCLSESIFATYPCSVKCNLQTVQGSRNPNSFSNSASKLSEWQYIWQHNQ